MIFKVQVRNLDCFNTIMVKTHLLQHIADWLGLCPNE